VLAEFYLGKCSFPFGGKAIETLGGRRPVGYLSDMRATAFNAVAGSEVVVEI
jgi:hypothetical protein